MLDCTQRGEVMMTPIIFTADVLHHDRPTGLLPDCRFSARYVRMAGALPSLAAEVIPRPQRSHASSG